MICSKCGAEIRDDAKICVKCGTPVGGGEAPDKQHSHYEQAKEEKFGDLQKQAPKTKAKDVVLLGVLVVLVLVGVAILVWRFTREEEKPPPPPPKPEVERPKPTIDQGKLAEFMTAKKPEAVACYAEALKKDATLAGTVEIKLKVNIDGKVHEPELARNLEQAPDVGTCVLEKLKTWEFPKAQNGMVPLLQSFTFTPEDVKPDEPEKKGKKGKKGKKKGKKKKKKKK